MKNKELQRRMAQEILALADFHQGVRQPGLDVIQLGELNDDQIFKGLTARLEASYSWASHHRTPVVLRGAAVTVLGGAKLTSEVRQNLLDIVE